MVIFLDLETTGLEIEDKIVSIGLIIEDNDKIMIKYELVNDGKKIPPKASSIHHITNEMIKDKSSFKDSDSYKFLELNNNEDVTLVAHNINFDLQKLMACGIRWRGKMIDTLRVTKHLIPECEFFSLQFLRYELKLYKKELQQSLACGIDSNIVAHNALSDALVVKLLYDYLRENTTMDEMYELSFKNVLLDKINFGKYKERYIEEIVMNDRGYLEWLLLNVMDLDEDLRYSIIYYLEGC